MFYCMFYFTCDHSLSASIQSVRGQQVSQLNGQSRRNDSYRSNGKACRRLLVMRPTDGAKITDSNDAAVSIIDMTSTMTQLIGTKCPSTSVDRISSAICHAK